MKTFVDSFDPPGSPAGLESAIAAIGNFDGLHRGHRAVIARAQALARQRGRPCVLLTFEPHPSDFFARGASVFRLTPPQAKAREAERLGLDGVIALRFDEALARLSAQEFVDRVLVERLGLFGAVVGYDFHFGAKRLGNPQFLLEEGARRGLAVEIVERVGADESGALEAVSSTATRAALEIGDVARAARLLGRPWSVFGEVIHGRKVGRTLGFPTLNLALDPSCRLRHGVYAMRVRLADGRALAGAASFGSRPTFDNGPPLLEIHLLDFEGDLYGQTVEAEFIAFLRPELKFDTLEALVERMNDDVTQTRRIVGAADGAR